MLRMSEVPRGVVESTGRLTLRGTITTSGHSVDHVQYLTERFVITELGRSIILHSPELGGRFVVDRGQRKLRRVDPASQAVQVEHLRELVGVVSVHRDKEQVEIDGFMCRRYRLCNDSSRLVVAAEAWCTGLPAIAATALHDERELEARLHPFALPLERDELVVRSTTRTYANGFQHTQSYRLTSVADVVEDAGFLEELLAYPIADG